MESYTIWNRRNVGNFTHGTGLTLFVLEDINWQYIDCCGDVNCLIDGRKINFNILYI